jgi:thioredoxin 1
MRDRIIYLFSMTIIAMGLTFAPGLCLGEGKVDLEKMLSQGKPILLEFGRGWCKPCKYMKPILDDMAKAYSGRAIVTTVDMDANAGLVRDFRIIAMPTQVFLTSDGKEFHRNMGVLERPQIVEIFSKMGVAPPNSQGSGPGGKSQAKPW